MKALSAAARSAFEAMDMKTYQYQSDFARKYHSQGIAEGLSQGIQEGLSQGLREGRAELVIRLLEARFGQLDAPTKARVHAASIGELDAIAVRLLTARSARDALKSL